MEIRDKGIELIKKRAELKALGYGNSDVNKQDYYLGYCDGATDQRRLDIDKACEWLKTSDWLDGVVIKNYLDEFEREFRKAMEEIC